MTATEYLEQYRDATREIVRAEEEYRKEMELIISIRSPLGGDGMPRSGEVSKKVEADAIRLAEKALDVKEMEIRAVEVRQEIVRTINRVHGPEADVLMEKYVKLAANGRLKTWRAVAEAVGYSEDNVYKLRRKGLAKVEELIR